MGQDGENGEGDHTDLTIAPGPRRPAALTEGKPAVFRSEVCDAVRYERGLAVKAAVVLVVVAIIVVLRTLYLA